MVQVGYIIDHIDYVNVYVVYMIYGYITRYLSIHDLHSLGPAALGV